MSADLSWNPPLQSRWNRIQHWCTDASPMGRRFRARLREQTGWSAADGERAIEEYRRFCLLACLRGGAVAPSAAVDAVWHLHLTWTRDYWQDFCPQRLGFELHHQPSLAQPGEREHLRSLYIETLHAYAALFGHPDPRWWPDHALAPLAAASRWAGLRRRIGWIAGACGLGLSGAAQALPANPLDWAGPDFLVLYAVLLLLCPLLGRVLGARQASRQRAGAAMPGEPSLWELAYLAGGAGRLAETLVAELHRRGWASWDPNRRMLVVDAGANESDPLLRTALAAIRQHPQADLRSCMNSAAFAEVQQSLVRRGWWFDRATATRIAALRALPTALLVLFGAAKIATGIGRDRPVLWLSLLTALALLIAIVQFLRRPERSPTGDAQLARQRQRHQTQARAPRPGDLPLAVALIGSSALAGSALAGFHEARHPPSSDGGGTSSDSSASSSDSSSSSDSGGDSGGGCGGCGGGGD